MLSLLICSEKMIQKTKQKNDDQFTGHSKGNFIMPYFVVLANVIQVILLADRGNIKNDQEMYLFSF